LQKIDNNLFYIKNRGNFSSIGLSYGSEIKSELTEIIDKSILSRKRQFSSISINDALATIGNGFQKNYPYLWDEMEGICTSSGISSVNFQIYLFGPALRIIIEDNGCTDIIFPDSDKGPVLGKTHDATTPKPGLAVVRSIRSDTLNHVLCVTRADGISTMTGLNDKGLAVGEASLHFYTNNKSGTVRNLLLRPVLHECDNVKEAVEFLSGHPPVTAGFHFALVDVSGNAAIVERSPTEQNVRWSTGEAIFCTNHTATPFMRKKEKSRGKEGDRNSDTRYHNMVKLTQDNHFHLSFQYLKEILTFHDKIGGICQHGDPDYQREKQSFYPLFTQRSFINIVKTCNLLVSNGPPCLNEFLEFSLD
jgi:predicted choloylglycine hydrolase